MTHDKINKKKHSTLIDIFRQKIKTSKAMLIVLFVMVLNEGRRGVCVCVWGGGGGAWVVLWHDSSTEKIANH